jgi:hypothetical protein
MNTLQSDKRHPRDHNPHLEYLDDRVVPSTVQPDLIAAEVATVHANAASAEQHHEAAESKIEIRRENRMAKIAERQEKATERRERASELREARVAKLAARHQSSAAVVVGEPVGELTVTNFGAGGFAHSTGGSFSTGSAKGAGGSVSPAVPVSMIPISPSAITPTPTTPSQVTPSPVNASPLPANVSVVLGSVYQEFQNGTLPTSPQPGQPEIRGNNVGIQIHSSDPSDFASMVANAESLGLQVTTVSSDFDIVVGFLPIANLPAIAQLAGAPSITPTLTPALL